MVFEFSIKADSKEEVLAFFKALSVNGGGIVKQEQAVPSFIDGRKARANKEQMAPEGFPEAWKAITRQLVHTFRPFYLSDVVGEGAKVRHYTRLHYKAWVESQDFDGHGVQVGYKHKDRPQGKANPYEFVPYYYENGKTIYATPNPDIEKQRIKGAGMRIKPSKRKGAEDDLEQTMRALS